MGLYSPDRNTYFEFGFVKSREILYRDFLSGFFVLLNKLLMVLEHLGTRGVSAPCP